jgi:hypothetical protein
VADALWELAEKYDVGVWYEYVRVGTWSHQFDVFCGVVVDGVRLDQPHCRTAEECVKQILEDYKRELERLSTPSPPPPPDPAEELLKEWPELQAFSTEWVRSGHFEREACGDRQGYAQIPVDGGGGEAEAGV